MGNVIVYGFPVSTFVNIVRLVLTEKGVSFTFCDLEQEMGSPRHLALHPFNRVSRNSRPRQIRALRNRRDRQSMS